MTRPMIDPATRPITWADRAAQATVPASMTGPWTPPQLRHLRATLVALAMSLALTACHDAAPPDDAVCRCTPGNVSRTRLPDGTTLDGAALLSKLRRHKRDVEQRRMPRDIKVLDDQLRFEILSFCQPCGSWVGDRLTIEAMFPLDRLDDAVDGVCMGLVLRDGTTAYGDARPRACR